MVDLSGIQQGHLGQGVWFSNLVVGAIRARLTGGILVKTSKGDAAVFTRDGYPVHVAGTACKSAFLGQILEELEACRPEHVQAAIEAQTTTNPPQLLGAILMRTAGLDPEVLKRAIQLQNQRRLSELFSLEDGQWQSAPGENARILEIGVPTAPWPIVLEGLVKHAPDLELRALSDRFLGRAVQRPVEFAMPELELSADQKRILQYLDKPRKFDQLERALGGRRKVRGFVRGLELLEQLSLHPVAKAISIPKASLLNPDSLPGADQARAAARRRHSSKPGIGPPGAPEKVNKPAAPRRRQSSQALWAMHPLVREIELLHTNIINTTHFEILGATESTPKEDLRKIFTGLAKKYHPDALPQNVPTTVAEKAREITARLNEAYQTLTNDQKRAEYLTILKDSRIRGDSKRADLVRDAETRAKMGMVLIRKKDFAKARELFKIAMNNDPETASHKAHYAWSLFADPGQNREEAIASALPLLKEALQKEGNDPNTNFYVAQVYKASGRSQEALFHFRKVAQVDPKHTEALREIRLMEMRETRSKAEAKDRSKSTLSKLFKKE